MFNKKYTDELLKEKVDKLSQLDRIEFNQRVINENVGTGKFINYQLGTIICSSIFLVSFFSFFIKLKAAVILNLSFFYKMYSFASLISLALGYFCIIMCYLAYNKSNKRQKQFQEENEQFIKERLKKK